MMARRQIWDSFRIILGHAHDDVLMSGTFQSWVAQNYIAAQGIAVRRQIDLRDDVISLARLIARVRRFPEVLSRDHYAQRISGWASREEADDEFDRLIGAGDHIDPSIPTGDLQTLRAGTQKIRTWATKEVAHYDPARGQFVAGLTFVDLHAAVDLVIDMAIAYRSRILGSHMARDISMPAWEGVFRVPWISEDRWEAVMAEIRETQQRRRNAAEG